MKIEIELTGFTPILDSLIKKYSLVTASVYGIVWRYAQMEDKTCKASLEKIGARLDLSGKTVERHIKKLCADGYLTDLTPGVRNKPHVYAITRKAELAGSISARSDRESDQGQTESPTRSDRESDQGQTESLLKIHNKKQTKIQKDSSADADCLLTNEDVEEIKKKIDFSASVSLLSLSEIKTLKLPLSDWKQHLEDEQSERQRKGVIDFLEKKIATGPLLPDTPAAHVLFGKLAIEAEAKGRRPPQRFPSLACKEKFGVAAVNLNGTLEGAINKALESGITSIPKIVNYISSPKWRNNDGQASGNTKSNTGSTKAQGRGFQPGNGRSAETQRRLEAAFAPKPG
jgi:DNA-binding Lrp family transcriptional regulator